MSDGMEASHKRWDGRQKTINATMWSLDAGGFKLRCVRSRENADEFIVQVRSDEDGWKTELTRGKDPTELLAKVTSSATVITMICRAVAATKPKSGG